MNVQFEKSTNEFLFDSLLSIGTFFNISISQENLVDRISQLSEEKKSIAMRSLADFNSVLQSAQIQKIDISKNSNFLKFWLKEMGYRAPFEIDDYIAEGDIIEIYDLDMVQISRNHTFYKFCSYDPLTLATTPFPILFKRDDSINKILFQHIEKCLDGNTQIHEISTPTHTMQEHYARNSKVYQIEHKYCSPLFKVGDSKPMAIFCTQRAKCIGTSNISGIGKVYDH